jgi:hypothetical protein
MDHRCDDSNQEPHVDAVPSRREALIAGAALVAAPFLRGVTSTVQAAQTANAGQPVGRAAEWVSYGGDKASSKYSPLAQGGVHYLAMASVRPGRRLASRPQ